MSVARCQHERFCSRAEDRAHNAFRSPPAVVPGGHGGRARAAYSTSDNRVPRPLQVKAVASPRISVPDSVRAPAAPGAARVDGKFLAIGSRRFLVKGVAYGTFAPDEAGDQFPPLARIHTDFAQMVRAGINTVRTYTPPPDALLDAAAEHGLRVMVGLPWPQHTAFLETSRQQREIRDQLRAHVLRVGRHPAVLLIALGNEIPPSIVRWYGPSRIERFLRTLYEDAKAVRPESLLTYVNFPPTEYLELPFFDVCAFNVYLHDPQALAKYLARLQHVAGNKPLLLAEAGADGFREGFEGQAALTAMQVRCAFEAGACGAIAFSWTDEWWRGGHPIEDWAFGLVTADRRPKPALAAVSRVFATAPATTDHERDSLPFVSVVVCARNAAATLDDCLQSIARLRYPCYETIVINDGSTDATPVIARRYAGVRVVNVPGGGLALARNTGAALARGEIVAYTDADVRVDPDWLTYLVRPFRRPDVVAAGGPNVVPPDDPRMAQCVARAPGAPTHVMLDDEIAEHVPGCNLAIRRDALQAIGGFNPIFLRAGDDVDVCWRLQAAGGRVAFAPAALVWHHHRASIRAYWRQQVGYGEGERWLRPLHPERFHGGSPYWRGSIYGPLPLFRSLAPRRVNAGPWGTALFPSVYRAAPHPMAHLPHSITWQVATAALALLALLLLVLPDATLDAGGVALAALAMAGATVGSCVRYALRTDLSTMPAAHRATWRDRFGVRATIALLYYLQPLARLCGHIRGVLNPPAPIAADETKAQLPTSPVPVLRLLSGRWGEQRFWSEQGVDTAALLERIARRLRSTPLAQRVEVDAGWWTRRDISVPIGPFARVDLRMLVEDHGAGRSLVRAATSIRLSLVGIAGGASVIPAAIVGARQQGFALELLAVLVLATLGWRLFSALRAARLVSGVVRDVAESLGLMPLDNGPDPHVRPLVPAAGSRRRAHAVAETREA